MLSCTSTQEGRLRETPNLQQRIKNKVVILSNSIEKARIPGMSRKLETKFAKSQIIRALNPKSEVGQS
jgi:hypothetical protein